MPLSRKRLWIGAVSLCVLILVASVGVVQTSTTDFCMSCHEMQVYKKELQASSHAKDAQGQPISCAQCHIPGSNLARMLSAKAYLGVRDAWAHFTGQGYDLDRADVHRFDLYYALGNAMP